MTAAMKSGAGYPEVVNLRKSASASSASGEFGGDRALPPEVGREVGTARRAALRRG